MKKNLFVVSCLLMVGIMAHAATTNLNLGHVAINTRLASVTNLQVQVTNLQVAVTNLQAQATNARTAVLGAGLADIGFTNVVISSAFTNAAYAVADLSGTVGSNVALVTLQFKGLASTTVSLRTYGDTNTVDDSSINSAAIASGSTANMTVLTDTNGCVDVRDTGNTSMNLLWFIRRHDF